MLHYHIRWASGKLDWESFLTEDEAKRPAKQLMRPNEAYAVEQMDGNCPRCAVARLSERTEPVQR